MLYSFWDAESQPAQAGVNEILDHQRDDGSAFGNVTVNYNAPMSEAIAFDTHRFVKNLTQNGFAGKQAEALATEQVQLLNSNLATKADILALQSRIESVHAGLQTDLQTVKADLLKWIPTAIVAQGWLVVALIKLL